jgi:CRISPR-associated protein Csx1
MNFIYQIGRFDKNYENDNKFVIDNIIFESKLSSFALKKYLKNQKKEQEYLKNQKEEQVKLTLIYPISIPFNNYAIKELKDKDKFVKIFIEKMDSYLENPKEVLKHHPYNSLDNNSNDKADDFIIVHSFGKYKLDNINKEFPFEAKFYDIVLEILIHLIESFLSKKDEKNNFYIDISSGHNIYISALLEAVKNFFTFSALLNWKNKNLRPDIYITFSEPITDTNENKSYNIYMEKIDFYVSFYSPLTKEEIDKNLGERIACKIYDNNIENIENRKKRKKLDEFIFNFGIIYSALKNNTPLVLYHFNYNSYDEIINLIKEILKEIKSKIMDNYCKSHGLDKDSYLKVILSLALYAGITELLQDKQIKNYKDQGVNILEIKQKFHKDNIYKIFGIQNLNIFLENEISNITESKKLDEKADSEWKCLAEIFGEKKANFDNIRNFIAHSGFEKNITYAKKVNHEIYLKYHLSEEETNLLQKKLMETI